MKVKIINWEKHNPRKDLKRPWYFNFDVGFWEDPKIFKLENNEKLLYIYFLSQRCKANKEEFEVCENLILMQLKMRKKSFSKSLATLYVLGMISFTNDYAPGANQYLNNNNEENQELNKKICTESVQVDKIRLDKNKENNKRKTEIKAAALRSLNLLNKNINTNYKPVDSTLQPFISRLNEGYSENDLKLVMSYLATKSFWRENGLLNPASMLKKKTFAIYLAEAEKYFGVQINSLDKVDAVC
jgi:uncharacterized phage protein (TIGR02220 family)